MANEINIGINTTSDTSGISKVEESVKGLKSQLKEAIANVAILSAKFGDTSKEAIAAAKHAAILKDRIGDAKSLTDAFNPDAKFKALSGSLVGVAGGFSALTGAMAMFGNENKDVEKAILKVQAAMAVASGVQAVGESVDAFKQLGAVIKSTTIFQTISTAAQKLWNAAMSANPIGAFVLVITTLIAAGYGLIKMFETSNKTLEVSTTNIDKNKKSVEKQTEAIEKSRIAKENLDLYELRLMKAQGKSEEAILKRTIAIRKANVVDAATEEQLKRNTLELYRNTIANFDNVQSQLDKQIAAEEFGSVLKVHFEEQKKDNERELVNTKEKLQAITLAYNSAAKNLADARELEKKAEQDLIIHEAQQKTDAEKAAAERKKGVTKKNKDDAAAAKQTADEKIVSEKKKQDDLIKSLHEKFNTDLQKIEDDSETKRAETAHINRVKEINEVTDFLQKRILLDEEKIVYNRELKAAELIDDEKHNVEVISLTDKFIIEVEDVTYKGQKKKIQDKYEADVLEIKKIKDQNLKIKLLGELKVQNDDELGALEVAKKQKNIEAIAKMAMAAAEIGNFIADRMKESAGSDKARQKSAVRVGAASSIAGVVASTAMANSQFIASVASGATLGLAAIAPVAANVAGSVLAIANIVSQKNKALAEIDNVKTDAGSSKSKFAMGGLIKGMGTGTSDSILANLSNGESVINAKSTAMFGNLLSNINEMGGGVSFGNNNNSKNNGNNIFKTYVVASEMSSQIEATNRIKQIARL